MLHIWVTKKCAQKLAEKSAQKNIFISRKFWILPKSIALMYGLLLKLIMTVSKAKLHRAPFIAVDKKCSFKKQPNLRWNNAFIILEKYSWWDEWQFFTIYCQINYQLCIFTKKESRDVVLSRDLNLRPQDGGSRYLSDLIFLFIKCRVAPTLADMCRADVWIPLQKFCIKMSQSGL